MPGAVGAQLLKDRQRLLMLSHVLVLPAKGQFNFLVVAGSAFMPGAIGAQLLKDRQRLLMLSHVLVLPAKG